jgi:hypothetical protein
LSSRGVVGRAKTDAVVVNYEYALIPAGECRNVNPLRTGRDRVCKQIPQDDTENFRWHRELAGHGGDDFDATISKISDHPLQAVSYSRYLSGTVIRAHRLKDRVDEFESVRQACVRIPASQSGDER